MLVDMGSQPWRPHQMQRPGCFRLGGPALGVLVCGLGCCTGIGPWAMDARKLVLSTGPSHRWCRHGRRTEAKRHPNEESHLATSGSHNDIFTGRCDQILSMQQAPSQTRSVDASSYLLNTAQRPIVTIAKEALLFQTNSMVSILQFNK